MKASFYFEPMFFVLDKLTRRVMAVKKQDKYEMSGIYFAYSDSKGWEYWPANLGNQEISFHPTTYELTKSNAEACQWAFDHRHLTDREPGGREYADYAPAY